MLDIIFCVNFARLKSFFKLGVVSRSEVPIMRHH